MLRKDFAVTKPNKYNEKCTSINIKLTEIDEQNLCEKTHHQHLIHFSHKSRYSKLKQT